MYRRGSHKRRWCLTGFEIEDCSRRVQESLDAVSTDIALKGDALISVITRTIKGRREEQTYLISVLGYAAAIGGLIKV